MQQKDKKISLCLGGGGARGFIHVGVLKYLEEQGYEIIEVSGTSMGAIIAGSIASGMNADEIYDFIESEFSYWKLIDFSFSKGFIAGDKIFSKFGEVFGKTKIQNMKIPLKIVASCIDTSEKVVFETGSIVDAVRASMSVPGVFAPHTIDGKHYMDGMLVENLPISVLDGNTVLAVSTTLSPEFQCESTKQFLTKAFNIALIHNEKHSLTTPGKNITLIQPLYDTVDFFDFHKFPELVDIGYNEAKKVLENI